MKVVSPRTLEDALAALAGAGPDARILAGGTDLMVEMEAGRTRPDLVVDVGALRELRAIRRTAAGLDIGACATCTDLVRSKDVRRQARVLADAASEVGAVQIQNRATIGGNLGTASPAADLVPVLFALGARVRLVSRRGARELPVEEFVTGYRTTARCVDELIEAVLVPRAQPGERRAFRKVGTRRAQSIAKVVVAIAVCTDASGNVSTLRAAAGSVAERTLRLAHLERALIGKQPGPAVIARAAAESALRDARPRDDVRSTAEYRRVVLARLVARLLSDLLGSGPR